MSKASEIEESSFLEEVREGLAQIMARFRNRHPDGAMIFEMTYAISDYLKFRYDEKGIMISIDVVGADDRQAVMSMTAGNLYTAIVLIGKELPPPYPTVEDKTEWQGKHGKYTYIPEKRRMVFETGNSELARTKLFSAIEAIDTDNVLSHDEVMKIIDAAEFIFTGKKKE